MLKALILLFVFTFTNTICLEMNTYIVDKSQWINLQPIQFIERIANSQPQILRKITLHYLTDKIVELRNTMNNEKINQQIYQMFNVQKLNQFSANLHLFMKEKLFSKLEMQKLSVSFKDEIEKNPEAYFLTFDMYDLLID